MISDRSVEPPLSSEAEYPGRERLHLDLHLADPVLKEVLEKLAEPAVAKQAEDPKTTVAQFRDRQFAEPLGAPHAVARSSPRRAFAWLRQQFTSISAYHKSPEREPPE